MAWIERLELPKYMDPNHAAYHLAHIPIISCTGTTRTYDQAIPTTIVFTTLSVCGLDFVFTIFFRT